MRALPCRRRVPGQALEGLRERGFGLVIDLLRDRGDQGPDFARPIGAELHARLNQVLHGRHADAVDEKFMHSETREVAPVSRKDAFVASHISAYDPPRPRTSFPGVSRGSSARLSAVRDCRTSPRGLLAGSTTRRSIHARTFRRGNVRKAALPAHPSCQTSVIERNVRPPQNRSCR